MFYITKYALTDCIIEVEDAELLYDGKYLKPQKGNWGLFTVGKEAFLTLDEAKQNVRKKAARKVVALEKQLKKMRAIVDGEDIKIERAS